MPKERVFQVLKEATKKDLANVRNIWDDLLMSLSVTQRAMLHASEAKAASASGVVIAFDYEIVCQRAANDQDLQLTLHNQISRMISDYAPQAVFITKESWPILRQEFIAGGQTFNTGELDEGEAEPEPTTEEPEDQAIVDPEDVDMLQDMLILAVNDGLTKIEKETERTMGKYTKGIPGL